MHKLTTRRLLSGSLSVVLLAALSLVGIDRFGRSSRVTGPPASSREWHRVARVVEEPGDAYRIWKEAGYRGRTIVYVSGSWESFKPGSLIPEQMFRPYPLQIYNTAQRLEQDHLDRVTFLYVASMNGILRRIAAVVPEGELPRIKEMARKVKDARIAERTVFMSREGFPRWYFTAASFQAPKEPVLLYVGASYFENNEPEELYRLLAASGLSTDCVVLCKELHKKGSSPQAVQKLERFARLPAASPVSGGKVPSPAGASRGTPTS